MKTQDDFNVDDFTEIDAPKNETGYEPKANPETYLDLLRPNRENKSFPGFNFDMNTFENLCAIWTPKKDFAKLLNCQVSDLDRFCYLAYNMKFNDAYDVLSGIADIWGRRVITNLAARGNNTALSCLIKHFMKLEDQSAPQQNIVILNDLGSADLPLDPQDNVESVQSVQDSQGEQDK